MLFPKKGSEKCRNLEYFLSLNITHCSLRQRWYTYVNSWNLWDFPNILHDNDRRTNTNDEITSFKSACWQYYYSSTYFYYSARSHAAFVPTVYWHFHWSWSRDDGGNCQVSTKGSYWRFGRPASPRRTVAVESPPLPKSPCYWSWPAPPHFRTLWRCVGYEWSTTVARKKWQTALRESGISSMWQICKGRGRKRVITKKCHDDLWLCYYEDGNRKKRRRFLLLPLFSCFAFLLSEGHVWWWHRPWWSCWGQISLVRIARINYMSSWVLKLLEKSAHKAMTEE